MLGPVGDKVEEWTLKGAWVEQSNFNEMDWNSGTDPMMINLTVRYDYSILQY
jgi:hypothetical protein